MEDSDDNDDRKQLPFPDRPPLRFIDVKFRPNCFNLSKRYILAIMINLGWLLSFAARTSICLFEHPLDIYQRFQSQLLILFSLVFVLVQIPAAICNYKYSAHKIFGICMLLNFIIVLVTPLFNLWSEIFLYVFTVLRGLFQGMAAPSIFSIFGRWAPPSERATLFSISYSGIFMGMVIGSSLSELLCPHIHWQLVLSMWGLFGIVWYFAYIWLTFDDPKNHPTILDSEYVYLTNALNINTDETNEIKEKKPIPWRKIFTSGPLYALLFVHTNRTWENFRVYQIEFAQFIFIHNEDTFHTVVSAGIISIGIPLMGFLADYVLRKSVLSVTSVRKYFICSGLALIILTHIPFLFNISIYRIGFMPIIYFITEAVFFTIVISSAYVNHIDIAGPFACVTNALGHFVACVTTVFSIEELAMAAVPFHHETMRSIIAILLKLITLIIFAVFGSGEEQDWVNGNTNAESSSSAAATV